MNLTRNILTAVIVAVMMVVCFGCGKTENKKETVKETTVGVTKSPIESASRVSFVPIKDLGNIQFGMLKNEVNDAVKNNKNFLVNKDVKYKYKGYEGTVDFEYENGFLNKIDIDFYGASEKLFDKLHKKYAKQYKVLKNHESVTSYGVTMLVSGFEGNGYAMVLTYLEDEGELTIHYGRL